MSFDTSTLDSDYSGNIKIAVIGLGYVGLPLAVEFAKKYLVVGFDINLQRIFELENTNDRTKETRPEELRHVIEEKKKGRIGLQITSDKKDLHDCNIFIVAVPTSIDRFKAPDLGPLIIASEMIGAVLKIGDIVIFESTVYPGCTEEDCVPVLEMSSGLKFNTDFYVGYSPERINPGDKHNTLVNIKKVTSGSTPLIAEKIDDLYRSIIAAGTYKAPSIKVAEASKAIENAQRDVNISFVNELALIFDRMNIDTHDVLEAAATKWNFLRYEPGLVGGHCISVDPYYLAHKAESLGYHSQVMLSGRRVNDDMAPFLASKVVKLLISKGRKIMGCNVLILGIAFKGNCPDIRNTKVITIFHELVQFGLNVEIYDPWADEAEVLNELGVKLLKELPVRTDAIILAVAHKEFLSIDYKSYKEHGTVIYDAKSFIAREFADGRL